MKTQKTAVRESSHHHMCLIKDETKQKLLTKGPLDTTRSSHGRVDSGPEAKGGMTWLHIRRCTIERVGT